MYRSITLLSALCICAVSTRAQDGRSVANAEKQFAELARQADTRTAFLKFTGTDGVVFNRGKAVNAQEFYTKKRPSTEKLLWAPAFAGIASSGELGFTAGPWQYKKTLADTAIAAGMFASVWRKDAQGEWKNIVDIGTSFKDTDYKEPSLKISVPGKAPGTKPGADIQALEQTLNDRFRDEGYYAYKEVLAPDCWLILNDQKPVSSTGQQSSAIGRVPRDLMMTPAGSGISKNGDLAYVYGNVSYKDEHENYLRIWKRTANGWKIILQVLNW